MSVRAAIRLLAVPAACLSVVPCAAARTAPSAPANAGLPWVHAIRGPEARIVDEHGRQVLFHGANVNQLGDYFKKNSHPQTAPLTREDFVQMRKLGWNQVRLIMHWSLLEPQPGRFSEAYVAKLLRAVRWAREQNMYTLIDMHQDAYGKYIAARPGEVCPPGMEKNLGWDGAPQWATLDGGGPRCNPGQTREVSLPVATAFQNLWNDAPGPGGVGIQTRLVRTWQRVAAAFANEPAVMGYDLFNEPSPGQLAIGNEGSTFIPFYRRAIASIRAVDRRHAIFVEPSVLRSAISDPTNMPVVSADANLVYAPHVYADRNGLSPEGKGRATDREFTNAAREAAAAGGAAGALPVFIGEFGALDPPARTAYNTEFMTLTEKHIVGWSHWVWKDTCGDPHTGYGTFPDESVNTYDCANDRFTGVKPSRRFAYSRVYPTHTAGRIERLSFDPVSKRFELAATEAPIGGPPTRLSIPLSLAYGGSLGRVTVSSSGLGRIRLRRCSDGTALLTARPIRASYTLVLSRRRGAARRLSRAERRAYSCSLAG